MKFFGWARRLLRPDAAARPGTPGPAIPFPGRVMHLAGPLFAPACGEPRAAFVFMTAETAAVTCQTCRVIASRRDVRREVSLR